MIDKSVREEFRDFMYNVFDSIQLAPEGIIWVCKIYVTEYIWSFKDTISDADFTNLLNDLYFLITSTYDHMFNKVDLKYFRTEFQREGTLIYNKEVMYSYISEYLDVTSIMKLEKEDTSNKISTPYGNFIDFTEENRADFYVELLSLYKIIGTDKTLIHDSIKEWLNVKILPKIKKGEMSKESLLLLTDVIDNVEKEYTGSIYRVVDLKALELIEDCKFKSVPWLCYGDLMCTLLNNSELHLNSAVHFTYQNKRYKGFLVGMQDFNEEHLFIVTSNDLPGEFKTVIVREVIQC